MRIGRRKPREVGQPGGYELTKLQGREVLQRDEWSSEMEDNFRESLWRQLGAVKGYHPERKLWGCWGWGGPPTLSAWYWQRWADFTIEL